jgi:cysteine-rich repeat protein
MEFLHQQYAHSSKYMNAIRRITLILIGLSLCFTISCGALHATPVYAQVDALQDVGDQSGLGDEDLTIVIAKLIRTFLTVLGIIAVVIVMYGGFVWMTAGGEPDKIEKAKKILINGGIGLGIILLSWAITTFVISALVGSTGGGSGDGGGSSSAGGGSGLGGGSIASFAVSGYSPEGEVSIRNVVPKITFSRQVDATSIDGNVIITKTQTGEQVDGTLSVSGNRISFTPNTACPEPSSDRFCFEESTQYTVSVDSDIESTAGVSLDCTVGSCTSTFTTGGAIDTDDPDATITLPQTGDSISVDSFTQVYVSATDDSEVSNADFYGNELWFDTVTASGDDLTDVTISSTWYTDGLTEGVRYSIDVVVSDIAGNEDEDAVRVVMLPSHCFDDQISGDETGEDCGGSCGACRGESCEEDFDCAGSLCEEGICTTGSDVDTSSSDGSDSDSASQGDQDQMPVIYSISPEEGGVGQYLTIYGSNFGSRLGSVWFENPESGYLAQGSVEFPDECDQSIWSDDQITIIVPSTYTNENPIDEIAHNLYIITQAGSGSESDAMEFTVTSDDPTPGICAIDPEIGEIGTEVTIFGDNFGGSGGLVKFYNNVTATVLSGDWSDNEIVTTVPTGAQTGAVGITSASGEQSNTFNFEVGSTSSVSAASLSGGYAWSFSTGAIPVTPELLVACSDSIISAVPNSLFTSSACTNSVLRGTFNTLMDESTLNSSNISVYECDGSDCAEDADTQVPFGSLAISSSTIQTSFIWNASASYNGGSWKTSQKYLVVVSEAVESVDGVSMSEDASWDFVTSASSVNCDVESVLVSPVEDTIDTQGATSEFNSLPITTCQVLDPTDYSWDWDTTPSSYISVGSCSEISDDYCAQATALYEGSTELTAEELESGTSGDATVIVNFADPYVSNYWPSCDTSCVNGQIGMEFNTIMSDVVEEEGIITLYSCANELCATLTQIDSVAHCSDTIGCKEVYLEITDSAYSGELESDSYYRVIVSGNAESSSGVALTRTNYGSDFSWSFGTKDDDSLCSVDRITLSPEDVVLENIGDSQYYEVLAFGSPDECSVSGQRLSAYGYDWNWVDPIIDEADIAEWMTIAGGLLDVDQSSIPEGCTASCISQGSQSYYSICGDGVRGVGEDCEDWNVVSGDGCSSSCLNEGTLACTETTTIGCCGNGSTDLHEECDDGNTVNGDGCSSVCLNEGSRAVGATCGNGDIAHEYGIGGEECDDGNTLSGDGCSALCLNEGSVAITQIASECGDGTIDAPYETCDDGDTYSGDGCSALCIREGDDASYSGFGSTGRCGDGVVDRNSTTSAGEDCDGGEGCSSDCLWEGSSLSYSSISVCGDGIAGIGENPECENSAYGAGPDSYIDPVQKAFISETAGEQVDEDTQLATATIAVSLDSLDASTSLSLSCVAEIDDDCDSGYGPADNKCCMPRPEVDLFPNGTEACRNAEIYGLFSTRMRDNSFTDNAFIELNLGSGDSCPTGYTILSLWQTSNSWLVRAFGNVAQHILHLANAQSVGDCVVPITGITQTQTSEGLYKVTFHYDTLLEADASYTIHMLGDTLYDNPTEGVLSYYGVAMDGDANQSFTTQDGICGLDAVEIEDSNEESQNTFSVIGEEHDFTATAYSYDTGTKQSIEPISGIYDWGWTSWESEDVDEDIIELTSESVGAVEQAQATYSAVGTNGEVDVVVSAVITADATGESFTCSDTSSQLCASDDQCPDDETCEAYSKSGSATLTAFVCENPWPAVSYFPFEDNADGNYSGVYTTSTLGRGWMNFSMYYCRDAGNEDSTSDDYSDLRATLARERGDENILKEYFFNVYDDGVATGDVIGVRIIKNESYLSPIAWYYANGFSGNPSQITIDGFNAIADGRTVYVSVPNYSSGTLYSNMFVISYNLGASDETIDIFNQLTQNLSFITNIDDIALCYSSSDGTYKGSCSSDFDCDSGEVCASDKLKLARDIDRLNDITDIDNQIASATPQLESGTFVRSLGSSVWTSWNEVLASEIGESIASDPVNQYLSCGLGAYAQYDAQSCVNQTTGAYICPVGSYTYHYRAFGNEGYELGAELEYHDGIWSTDIDTDTDDDRIIKIGARGRGDGFENGAAFCDGTTVWGTSATCGDGIVGSGEVCEIGDTIAGATCTTADGQSGYYISTCNSTCTAYSTTSDAVCDPQSCGNGVIEGAEDCDDGSLNGSYGFCSADCTDEDRVYCGDGALAGGELCDCGSSGTPSGAAYGGGACSLLNGVYDEDIENTCSWDCTGPGPYCGDESVDDSEDCDGNTDLYDGKLCSLGSSDDDTCDQGSDCDVPIAWINGVCGGTSVTDECPYTTVCVEGDADKAGLPCNVDSYCDSATGSDGVCSTYAYQTTRTRICDDASCNWEEDWEDIVCRAPGSCGDGIVDTGEECDDGNDDSTDACTIECTNNTCGDGYIYAGEEQCDEGDDNGVVCTASYGSTCTYCNEICNAVSSSGSFCGDGVINGSEACDADDVPYHFVSLTSPYTIGAACENYGEILDGSICWQVGTCNGGSTNGNGCVIALTSSVGSSGDPCVAYGGTCVLPECSISCSSMCPFDEVQQRLMIKTNELDARRSYSADIESFTTATTILSAGNSSTLYVPACSVAEGLTLSVDDEERIYPDVEIMLVLDRSNSMSSTLGDSTRIEVLREAVDDAVVALFDEYDGVGATMSVGWAYIGGKHDTTDSKTFLEMAPTTNETTLRSSISSGLVVGSIVGTPIYQSIEDAYAAFSGTADNEYMIIFTDGSIYNTDYADLTWDDIGYSSIPAWGSTTISSADYMKAVSAQIDDIKNDGVDVFSAVFTDNSCDIVQMERWSSMECTASGSSCSGQRVEGNYSCEVPDDGITYAYSATDASGIEDMYDQIVDSILNITISVTIDGETASTTVSDGTSRAISLPNTFVCDALSETTATLRATFNGSGTINLSNITMNMCTQ